MSERLDKRKIKDIVIIGSDGSGNSKVRFILNDMLLERKVTSTWYPQLLEDTRFNKRGDKLLEYYRLLKPEPFDNYYTLRGQIAEDYVRDMLVKKGYDVTTFENMWDSYNYHTDHPMGPLYKYFGGRPDIIYKDSEGKRHLLEIKSKSLSKKDYVVDSPPETEIKQGKMLALLEGLDAVDMTYVFFADEFEALMRVAARATEPFSVKEAKKLLEAGGFFDKIKNKIEIHKKTYLVDKKMIVEEMKRSYKYAETFRQTATIDIQDLSKDIVTEIFELEREIENERKRIADELEQKKSKKSNTRVSTSQGIANNPLYKKK